MIGWTSPTMANKRGQIMAKRYGTEVTMQWTEWRPYLSGVPIAPYWPSLLRPDVDPTTGATLADANGNGLQPELHGTTLKCMVHVVDHALNKYVQNQEVETGDIILDYIPPLVRVNDRNDVPEEDLEEGEVYTEWEFNRVIREFEEDFPGSGIATAVECTLESLNEDQSFIVDSVRYVQKPIGAKLSKSWDAIVAGVKFSRPLLLRRAT